MQREIVTDCIIQVIILHLLLTLAMPSTSMRFTLGLRLILTRIHHPERYVYSLLFYLCSCMHRQIAKTQLIRHPPSLL
jgi:hypothetical protein